MGKKLSNATPSRASALDRAAHGRPPLALTGAQRAVLSDAIREGTDVADTLEDRVRAYGRYLLAKVFGDDTREALDLRTKNPVWTELVRHAGGPTLKLSRKVLDVALRMAAYDRRITDETFRALDSGRKERLLPLGEPARMRQAAAHVTKFHLTQTDTEQYVTSLLAEDGKTRQVRFTAPQLVSKVKTLRSNLEKASTLRRVRELKGQISPKEREDMAAEMERLGEAVRGVAKMLRGK